MSRSISLKRRFEIFKRDHFVCQYCGRTPPAVVLEIDHVIAVSAGGRDSADNLVTSCFDCNRGKGSTGLGVVALNVKQKRAIMIEKQRQLRAYEKILEVERQNRLWDIQGVVEIFEAAVRGKTLTDGARVSIGEFLKRLPAVEVEEAMQLACSRVPPDRIFRYFCGVCWRKVEQDRRQ